AQLSSSRTSRQWRETATASACPKAVGGTRCATQTPTTTPAAASATRAPSSPTTSRGTGLPTPLVSCCRHWACCGWRRAGQLPRNLAPVSDSRLVIHGHFYQPPRENPWTEGVAIEPAAAPFHDWNQRITAESYRPNGWARVVDERGRITDI